MARRGSASSISSSPTRGNNSTKETLPTPSNVGGVEGVLPLLEKLCAAIGTMATRLGRLEDAYFDAARRPRRFRRRWLSKFRNFYFVGSIPAAQNAGFADNTTRGGMTPSSASPSGGPSPQTIVDYADNFPCDHVPSVQLFKPGAGVVLNGHSGAFALKDTFTLGGHDDKDVELGSADAPPSLTIPEDDTFIIRNQVFFRRSFVRLRLQKDCGLADFHGIQSHIIIAVRSWYVPAPPGSKSSARHLTTARVIAGFVQRDVTKWLLPGAASLGGMRFAWYINGFVVFVSCGPLCTRSNRSLHAGSRETLMCRRGAFIVCMWQGSSQPPTSEANGFSVSSTRHTRQPTDSTALTCLPCPPLFGCGRCSSSAVVGVGAIRLRSRCNCQSGKQFLTIHLFRRCMLASSGTVQITD